MAAHLFQENIKVGSTLHWESPGQAIILESRTYAEVPGKGDIDSSRNIYLIFPTRYSIQSHSSKSTQSRRWTRETSTTAPSTSKVSTLTKSQSLWWATSIRKLKKILFWKFSIPSWTVTGPRSKCIGLVRCSWISTTLIFQKMLKMHLAKSLNLNCWNTLIDAEKFFEINKDGGDQDYFILNKVMPIYLWTSRRNVINKHLEVVKSSNFLMFYSR